MKTYLDCIPCFMNQALRAGRIATKDDKKIKKLLDIIGGLLKDIPIENTPPEMGEIIYQKVREITGVNDPYKKIKEAKSIVSPVFGNSSNQLVLETFSGDNETISLTDGIIKINNGQILNFTSEKLLISDLNFVNFGNSDVDSIKFSYSVAYKNNSSIEFDYGLNLESTATIR